MRKILVFEVPDKYKDKKIVLVGKDLHLGFVDEEGSIDKIGDLKAQAYMKPYDTDFVHIPMVFHLRNLPEKKLYDSDYTWTEDICYYEGWNDCLKKIEGEIKDEQV